MQLEKKGICLVLAGLWIGLSTLAIGCGRGDDHRIAVSPETECVTCHRPDYDNAANPSHVERSFPTTCQDCHDTSAWRPALGGTNDSSDPARDVTVDVLIPTFVGTSISQLEPMTQTLPMPMRHGSAHLPLAASSNCSNCHIDAEAGSYFPGDLHSSLVNLGIAQPTECADCHATSVPTGFVGPLATAPARDPASGEMRHDAVRWLADAPTAEPLVTQDCGVCHTAPSNSAWQQTWATDPVGTGVAQYHSSLATAGEAQPVSCLDCHANSRPTTTLAAPDAVLPAGVVFDHTASAAMGECASCHSSTSSWSGARFHAVGSTTPDTCVSCHDGQRPTSDAGWTSTTYTRSPFDYGTNAQGVTHGDGQDCVLCHAGPGTGGAWGGEESWVGGNLDHASSSVVATTCIACHSSQRPDLQPGATAAGMAALLGFDHANDGQGDCFACHQATVLAGTYVDFWNPATGMLPGGDWREGTDYPGPILASSQMEFITVTEIALNHSGPLGLVTSMSSISATLYNGMLHTAAAVPSAVSPGTGSTPDDTSCWHCHTSTGTTVTAFANGRFHEALRNYVSTPGGVVAPLPQPTAGCNDCHAQMRPTGIVERAMSALQPMDHDARFVAPVTIGGTVASGAADLDCSVCHSHPGTSWDDGTFHARIGTAMPSDCTLCHYPGMADAPRADVTLGVDYSMRHRSGQITFQNCSTCHDSALGRSTVTPIVSTLWRDGAYHASLTAQPTACTDCHTVSRPSPTVPTDSATIYRLTEGATSTNGPQYMSHGSSYVSGRDCAVCHAAEATTVVAPWSHSTSFHAAISGVTTCQGCHGLTNGGGSMLGVSNNLPSGLTTSTWITSASAGTGVPSGTHDQITHADVNVTSHDCNFCHTQAGVSTVPSVRDHEWAQADFHGNFSTASPLVMNLTTGRCSNCHMNVRPTAAFTTLDHSAFTSTSASDCSSCHSYPGTGTALAPNWLGAAGVPTYIYVGGFRISTPPATTTTTQTGITNLPHPTVGAGVTCTTCHATSDGGRRAFGYDHLSSLIGSNCSSCHEAGSDLVGTVWNGATTAAAGAGDTRPFTLTSVRATFSGNSRNITYPNHFYPIDCNQCHVVPAGNGLVTTGTAYTTAWRFPHTTRRMTNPSTCLPCHPGGPPD